MILKIFIQKCIRNFLNSISFCFFVLFFFVCLFARFRQLHSLAIFKYYIDLFLEIDSFRCFSSVGKKCPQKFNFFRFVFSFSFSLFFFFFFFFFCHRTRFRTSYFWQFLKVTLESIEPTQENLR